MKRSATSCCRWKQKVTSKKRNSTRWNLKTLNVKRRLTTLSTIQQEQLLRKHQFRLFITSRYKWSGLSNLNSSKHSHSRNNKNRQQSDYRSNRGETWIKHHSKMMFSHRNRQLKWHLLRDRLRLLQDRHWKIAVPKNKRLQSHKTTSFSKHRLKCSNRILHLCRIIRVSQANKSVQDEHRSCGISWCLTKSFKKPMPAMSTTKKKRAQSILTSTRRLIRLKGRYRNSPRV